MGFIKSDATVAQSGTARIRLRTDLSEAEDC